MVAPGHLLSSSLHGSDWLSGGSVGPEGSVFCFLVIAVVWVAFDRVFSKRIGPDNSSAVVTVAATSGSSSLRSSE
jgi:hypothetical protein